ncbi:unnamed protein product [Eruca vesicaria subsp. sativa]|uniref:Uncharacterized protein n=1 Tax=Eruca vesicaria subsp. sativa TaxID=29727 RepID=A0ABC8LYI6_ERUVS|nr:unnamed protein product [Eruca vesicaria subsp. sativa]
MKFCDFGLKIVGTTAKEVYFDQSCTYSVIILVSALLCIERILHCSNSSERLHVVYYYVANHHYNGLENLRIAWFRKTKSCLSGL